MEHLLVMKPLVSVTVDSLMMAQIVVDAQKVTPETLTVEIVGQLANVSNMEVMLLVMVTEHVNKEVSKLFVLATQASLTTALKSAESAQILYLNILTVN